MPVAVINGGAVQTAYVSFTALDITAPLPSLTLVWPTSYFDVPSEVDGIFYNVLAASMTVNCGMGNVNTITLPNATESSVGYNFIITNIGLSSFNILLNDGFTQLITIPNVALTNSYWIQLTDNTTSNGEWQMVQFGAGTSQAVAATLAGNGLTAITGLLNTNVPVKTINAAPYNVIVPPTSPNDRATLLVWNTGTGVMNLPLLPNVNAPAGFYISINNEGTGICTVTATGVGVTIDNKPTLPVSPGQSLSIISDGADWWTLGFGQNTASANFAAGSAIAPSITFSADTSTGIYFYNNIMPPAPISPRGLGFTVGGVQIANLTPTGLYMTPGKSIILQDLTSIAQTIVSSNANYAQLSWNSTGAPLANPPTFQVSGTNTESTMTLGPFGTFSVSQTAAITTMEYNGITFLTINAVGETTFANDAVFNGGVSFNGAVAFAGTAQFNGVVTLSIPLEITSGGTGAATQQDAINALIPGGAVNNFVYYSGITGWAPATQPIALNAIMPPAPVIGDLIYYNGANWIRLPIGTDAQTLTVVGGIPAWA